MTYRGFIGMILAAAIAVTGASATPARAAEDDVAKVVVGAAALAILGAAIISARDDDDDAPQHVTNNHNIYNSYGDGYNSQWSKPKKKHKKKHSSYQPVKRPKLPEACRIYRDTKNGRRFGYNGRCLKRNYSAFDHLPRHCAKKVEGYRGKIWRENCLSQHGFQRAKAKKYKHTQKHSHTKPNFNKIDSSSPWVQGRR
ncbi:hypothetical protein ROA7450_01162 [Roseovarius albus]|uniref:Lectin-like protein BA14k n=1 Tax=Roseovarius albus TaxID=1247867 RepID=A0A1X6YQK0_9RHOB|nr:hypothetical protein [Roseovarius albus]SLN28372.1 hypothetical protein ROA7450_01162 [Roseovarius albus]